MFRAVSEKKRPAALGILTHSRQLDLTIMSTQDQDLHQVILRW